MFMEARCGAWQVGDEEAGGPVEFRVFYPAGVDPHVTRLRVIGTFQAALGGTAWDEATALDLSVEPAGDPRGTFWSASTGPLPAGFYEYLFLVTFDNGWTRRAGDPCTRYGGLTGPHGGIAVGGTTLAQTSIRPVAGGRRPLEDLVIYELMIDDFTAGYRRGRAPMTAVIDRLDDLRAAGFTAILFMPWTAGADPDFDWGYTPRCFYAVESRYVEDRLRPEEKISALRTLVNACHERGLHVLMDGVFNHVHPDFPYPQLYRDPSTCPFIGAFGGQFVGLTDLNFAHQCTQDLVDDVVRYWIDVAGLDGIRFDNTKNYLVPGTLQGLPGVLAHAADHARNQRLTNFSLTIEHIDLSAADVVNSTAATSFWDDELYGIAFDALWNDRLDSRLINALNNRRFLRDPANVPTVYLSNHDHSHITWQSGARSNVGAVGSWWRIQPWLIALFTSTGVPLVPNGQEFAEDHFIPEQDHLTGRRVIPRPLRWRSRDDPVGQVVLALHRRLATMRAEHPALRSRHMYPAEWAPWQTRFDEVGVGVDTERRLAVYHRWAEVGGGIENVVVVLNFSDGDQVVDVPFPYGGHWVDLVAGFEGGAPWSIDVPGTRAAIPVGSNVGRVLRAWRSR